MPQEQLSNLSNFVTTATYNKIQLYVPHDKQKALHAAGSKFNIRAFFAGNRVGKTYAGCMESSYHLTGLYPDWWEGHKFTKPILMWAASDTTVTTKDILQGTLLGDDLDTKFGTGVIPKDLIDRKSMKKIPTGNDAIERINIKHASGGYSTIVFKSYEQGRKKFQGKSVDYIHLDEEPESGIFTECTTRTATTKGHVLLTMTPLSGMTALMEHFMEKQPVGHFYEMASWEDNPYLPECMKETLMASYLPHELEARTKGIPSIGEGKVYPVTEESIAFDYNGNFPGYFVKGFGLDFGWNDTSVVVGAYDPKTDIVYIYDCYKEGAKHGTAREPKEHILWMPKEVKQCAGVCDPSGGGRSQKDGGVAIEAYREYGVNLTPANNSIENGIMRVLTRMREGKLKVATTPNMDKWWKEFRKYSRIANKSGTDYHFNADDHLMDAMRYYIMSGVDVAKHQNKINKFYSRNTSAASRDWTTL